MKTVRAEHVQEGGRKCTGEEWPTCFNVDSSIRRTGAKKRSLKKEKVFACREEETERAVTGNSKKTVNPGQRRAKESQNTKRGRKSLGSLF